MNNKNISFDISNDVITAFVYDDIDHHRARSLREAMDERIYSDRPTKFFLDMSGVTFMDSSGLGLILGRFTLCRELGIEFALTDPSPDVEKILELAGTGRLIRIIKNSKSVDIKKNK